MPKISLCMICRDEADLLPGCLESVRGAVDEIVVIDTGSTDDTRRITSDFNALVITAAWNDFSTARNQAIKRASGDWILVLDADEELILETPDTLRDLAASDEADAYMLTVINCLEMSEFIDLEKSPRQMMVRFFKPAGALYVNPVFETLKLPGGARVSEARGVDIVHYGFMPELMERKHKVERNLGLLEKWLETDADSPWPSFYMARQLEQLDKLTEAAEFYDRALPSLAAQNEARAAIQVYKSLARLYENSGDKDESQKILVRGVVAYPGAIDLRYAYGLQLLEGDDAEAAVEQFAECVALSGTEQAGAAQNAPIWDKLADSFTALNEPNKATVARAMAKKAKGAGEAENSEASADENTKALVNRIANGDNVADEVRAYIARP